VPILFHGIAERSVIGIYITYIIISQKKKIIRRKKKVGWGGNVPEEIDCIFTI